jgi:hypothetical protein
MVEKLNQIFKDDRSTGWYLHELFGDHHVTALGSWYRIKETETRKYQ